MLAQRAGQRALLGQEEEDREQEGDGGKGNGCKVVQGRALQWAGEGGAGQGRARTRLDHVWVGQRKKQDQHGRSRHSSWHVKAGVAYISHLSCDHSAPQGPHGLPAHFQTQPNWHLILFFVPCAHSILSGTATCF